MSPVLDALGPMPAVQMALDFESYYSKDYQLRKMTTEAYVRDSRFQVIGVGVKLGTRPAVWMEDRDFRAWSRCVDWRRVSLLAHHAHLEGLVLHHHYNVRPGFWRDTLSMARAIHGPGIGMGLGALAERYNVGKKGDDLKWTFGKRREDFTEAEWLKFGVYGTNDVDLTDRLFSAMLPGFPVEELWLIDMTIRMFAQPTFVADQKVLAETYAEEVERKRWVLALSGQLVGATVDADAPLDVALESARAALMSNDKFAQVLRALGVEPEMKQGKKGPTYAFAKTDPFMASLEEHPEEDIRTVTEARLEMKSTIVETRSQRIINAGRRGRVPFYLKYCGAHTNRWSGGDKLNPQNFNRGGALRRAILAPPGYDLVVADSGQIEARMAAWVARQIELLETFRRNDAITARYEDAMRERSGGRKLDKAEEKAIARDLAKLGIEPGDFYSDEGGRYFSRKLSKRETPIERQVSKNMILGLGFGMGWVKFSGELLKGMLGAPPVQFTQEHALKFGVNVLGFARSNYGRDGETCGGMVRKMVASGVRVPLLELVVHCAVAAHLLGMYRAKNKKIASFWKACDRALHVMTAPGDDDSQARGMLGCMQVKRHALTAPNGLTLHYNGLRRQGSEFVCLGGDNGRKWVKLYGAKMFENIVQKLARDVVAEQALYVRAAGYHVATTTHDEMVAVVPKHRSAQALDYMLGRMRIAPSWCADLPLNAEGSVAECYGDAK